MQIEVTEIARNKLLELGLNEERFLRLGVKPGGCAGMTYDAVIDDEMSATDQIAFEADLLRIVADKDGVEFLDGLKIDFSDDLVRPGFLLSNPNSRGSCGCGSSFGEGKSCGSGKGCGA